MILCGSSLSPFVRKVLAFAAEKGVELELQPAAELPVPFPALLVEVECARLVASLAM